MSAKTKIVVLHMKEVIYTVILSALGILLLILLLVMLLSKTESPDESSPDVPPSEESVETAATSLYIPGIYTTELVLGTETIDVEVIVNQDTIQSIRLVNLNDAVTTMYPLLTPSLEAICEQVRYSHTLENVTYPNESKYTSLLLLEAIQNSLNKAMVNSTQTRLTAD